jgi:predicted adenylyl cyclase CyaB
MPRNIEIKARIESVDALKLKVAALAAGEPMEMEQDDTFFRCTTGRLKLREFANKSGELIYYRRQDQPGPKESFYLRSPVAETTSLREILTLACGQIGRIRKHRILYLIDRTRVHLDRIQGLGDFLELEFVLNEGESTQKGIELTHRLMAQLGIQSQQLIDGAYVDLLGAKHV